MTVELRTMCHRSSVLIVSLDRALESFTFRDCSCIDLVASLKDISFDFLSQCIFISVLKFELCHVSFACNTSFCKMSLLSLCHTVTMNDFFFTIFVFVNCLIFLVNKTNLYCTVSIILYSLDLCYYTRTSLKNCYRSQYSVFVEDLSHSDLRSQNSFLHYNYLLDLQRNTT